MFMKTLIAYYSRTGTTKKVAEAVAKILGAEIEAILDFKNRQGVLGYLLSGREAMRKTMPEIKFQKNPADYDLVIIGTPTWGWNMASPVRSYLNENKGKFKKTAYICTMGGSDPEKVYKFMNEIIGMEPAATLSFKTLEVTKGDITEPVKKFADDLGRA